MREKLVTITFFGHKDTPNGVQPILRSVLKDLIENNSADLFYVGNQGAFDSMVRKTLILLKSEYPHIRYAVVLAYMPGKQKVFDCTDYTDTVFPEELENIPRRYAISKRNRWMVDRSDAVITYVTHTMGGAAQFKKLAEKKRKYIINLPDF